MFPGQCQGVLVAGRQQLGLSGAAPLPHRPHRMDNVSRLQVITAGDLSPAGMAASEGPAFLTSGTLGMLVKMLIFLL